MSNLIEEFKQFPEYRKARGKHHPLWVLPAILILTSGAVLVRLRRASTAPEM
jgi:hypothetical protein